MNLTISPLPFDGAPNDCFQYERAGAGGFPIYTKETLEEMTYMCGQLITITGGNYIVAPGKYRISAITTTNNIKKFYINGPLEE